MTQPHEQELDVLAGALKANLASPSADSLVLLERAVVQLRAIPVGVDLRRRIECLLMIAQQFHHQGQNAFSAVEPAALAVMHAKELGDKRLLRKSFNFQSIILTSTNNPGDALRAAAEALEIADELDDPNESCPVWNSLGTALYQAALYSDARIAFQRSAQLAAGASSLQDVQAGALQNEAVCCLHMHEYDIGIERIREAIALMPTPSNSSESIARVFAEGTYTRLLLAKGHIREAAERALLAKEFSAQAKSVRADISAACSEGLVEVYSGMADTGLTRAMTALEKARAVKPSLRETLLALVQAFEKAGKPDRALALHRELTLHIRKAQHDNIVKHQELHLKQLDLHEGTQFPDKLLDEKDLELRNKLAAQAVGKRQGDLLEQMAFTAEMRDDPTGEHCYRVARLAGLLAQAHGQSPETCKSIELAARLHDIGKVGVPDTLMQKRLPLSDGERLILQTHVVTGADLLSKTKVSYAAMAEEIARHHHERWDGNGYPDGILGSAISLPARIVAVCDVYDALTHDKPYRRALTSDEALSEIRRERGLQFEPVLVDVLVPLIAKLRAEHQDLDAFLGEAARRTSLTVARQKIAESLARPVPGMENQDQEINYRQSRMIRPATIDVTLKSADTPTVK